MLNKKNDNAQNDNRLIVKVMKFLLLKDLLFDFSILDQYNVCNYDKMVYKNEKEIYENITVATFHELIHKSNHVTITF